MILSTLADLLRPVTDFFKPEAERELPAPFFTLEEIGRLHRLTMDSRAGLDAQTWQDLLLEPYEESLTGQTSIFGRQLLHRRLRAGLGDEEAAALVERLRGLLDDAPRIDALTNALRPLRHAETEVAGLLFEGETLRLPRWARFTWLLPLVLLLSLGLLLTQPLGWMATLAAMAPLMGLQIAFYRRIEAWNQVLNSLQALLAASARLAALGGPLLEPFAAARAQNARLHERLARPLLFRTFPAAESYVNWFAAYNVRRYWRTTAAVHAARDVLRERYLQAATLEADLTLVHHLRSVGHWCWAERSAPRVLELDEGVHPLMDRPTALSIALEGRGAFISGQNASGKSTFLRMVGLNLVTARAFGFCYARRALLPAVPVRASMQNEDSLLGGESLYMSELRRARELLDAAGAPSGICLIDEVFRGTNHLESVSAASAVLESLAARDLVLVSSHNLVLARILAGKLEPFRIDTAGGAPSLKPGVLREPNGIALLASQGFGAEIEGRAAEIARWLSAHLAEQEAPSCA